MGRRKKEPEMDALTRDALAANAAGKHYGDYIAERHEARIRAEKEAEEMLEELGRKVNPARKCLYCGGELPSKRPKFCSNKCRSDYYRIKPF